MTRQRGVRRSVIGLLALAFGVLAPGVARAADEVRVGYQKSGALAILKELGLLEQRLRPLGAEVTWHEFSAGPQLLEALGAGAIDFGTTGDTPPVFAQARGVPLVYVGREPPAPESEKILVPEDSDIQSLADLKGRRIALNKASNIHFLLVRALEKAGLRPSDVRPVYLPPADARAAFERGDVDAWAIWDPYAAATEIASDARILTDARGLSSNHSFYLASRDLAGNGKLTDAVLAAVHEAGAWIVTHREEAAELMAERVGLGADVWEATLSRIAYGAVPMDAATVAEQQTIADTFHKLGLLPEPIRVADAVVEARRPAAE